MPSFALIKQSFVMSIQNILGNKKRSFLTMLGIIIGVAAVIALVSTVSGVSDYIMERFTGMGAGSITVSATGTITKRGITDNDMREIAALDYVQGVSPSVSVTTKVVKNNYVSDDVSVTGVNEHYFIHNDNVAYGRALYGTDMDGSVYVCVIDPDCAQTFFRGNNPIGQTLKIGGITYTVVGISEESDNIVAAFYGSNADGSIFIPYKNALTMNGKNRISSFSVYLSDTTKSDKVQDKLEALLDNIFNNADNSYMIINMETLTEMMDTTNAMMTNLIAGIASIALLVGGIGIMNMMLVSVTERTKEIGLRKALGAEPFVIQLQFLLESIVLSIIGGILGIILGNAISYVADNLIGIDFAVNFSAVMLGFTFSFAIGIIFGWAPARAASKLNPIDALRAD